MSTIDINKPAWLKNIDNSPKMNIQTIEGDKAICVWFDASGKEHRATYTLDSLTNEEPKKSKPPSRPSVF